MDFLVHHMLRASAARSPDKEALVHCRQRLSHSDLASKAKNLARGLREAGLARGDRVGVYLEASIPQVVCLFGVSEAEGVFVPIASVLFPDQVAHIARDCGMTALITSAEKLASLKPVLEAASSLRFVLVTESQKPVESPLRALSFEEICENSGASTWREVTIEKDLAAILYTSGSTGKPKGVMLSHAQIRAGSSIVSAYLDINQSERILAVLPFSFDAGLNQLMTSVQQGATLVLINFVFAREIVHALHAERITGLAGVPTLWSMLAQPSSGLTREPLSQLRYITNTGGAMPQTVLAALRQALPTTKIFLMYGLTEAFRSTYLPPEELDRRPTSIGKAIPNTEILVVSEEGLPCKRGEVGELVHRGPTVSMGYWSQRELTARALRPHPFLPPELGDTERVCYSGDLVRMDEEGFIYFVGRRDNMIKSSGFRVSPTEVEEVLFQTGCLKGAAVIGLPDEMLGQTIKAFVVPKDATPVDTDELLKFCAQKMPRHMVPKMVEVVDDLPKTSNGKVDYPALRRREGLTL